MSGSWAEGMNVDESGQGWIEYTWSTISGSGTGTVAIFLQIKVDITNGPPGVGVYSLEATALEFKVANKHYLYILRLYHTIIECGS